ncbi:hypothetical protein [Plantactinospora sp. WMMB782]|uniref:hypothetical protein n=1 Tax=Plantactinospora sp. WMMB782 TaxID=3404121 RepID=UPI003B94DA2E
MPTYAQLQAESWWGREVVTPEMDWLGDELCRRTGRPRAAAGTKGDRYHLSGGHRSQEWILKSRYCTSRTYTVQPGLTATQMRHVAAFDFTPGSVERMIAQCRRLIAAMKAGRLNEVLAIYGNVDGDRVVDGWDNVRDRAASSDSSHLWHWHLTLDRRHCADRSLMERILAVALGEPTEEDVDDATIAKIAQASSRAVHNQVLGKSGPSIGTAMQLMLANQQRLLGEDWVDEQQIIDGVLAGLGSRDLDDAATALRAAFGDRLPELLAKLTQS